MDHVLIAFQAVNLNKFKTIIIIELASRSLLKKTLNVSSFICVLRTTPAEACNKSIENWALACLYGLSRAKKFSFFVSSVQNPNTF